MKKSEGSKHLVVKNKKAFQSYFIVDQYEAGIELKGTEVKSIREGKVNIAESYCKLQPKSRELYVLHMNIAPYENGGYVNHAPLQKRKLLMHKREIVKLESKLVQRGYTLIPLSLYFKRGMVKLELGLAKGKKKFDKRETLKNKEAKREIKKY